MAKPEVIKENLVSWEPERVVFRFDGKTISPAELKIVNKTDGWIAFKVFLTDGTQPGR